MSDTGSIDLGITTGGDTLSHVLHLGTNDGGAFTPDGIAAAIEKLGRQIQVINGELSDLVAAQEVDTGFVADWSSFVIGWADWKTANSSWLSDAWNSTRDALLDWRSQYENLRTRWLALQPKSKAAPTVVKDAPANTIEDWGKQVGAALKHIGVGAAWVTVAFTAAYVVWKFR